MILTSLLDGGALVGARAATASTDLVPSSSLRLALVAGSKHGLQHVLGRFVVATLRARVGVGVGSRGAAVFFNVSAKDGAGRATWGAGLSPDSSSRGASVAGAVTL